MNLETIDLHETGSFSQLFLDYLNDEEKIKSFYDLAPTPDNFENQANKTNFSDTSRKTLVTALRGQYSDLTLPEAAESNLDSLANDNTYTITTGHQLNICTGPLYFIYKIVTVINTCKELNSKFPERHHVPVYWMATEDHDFDEINHFFLYGEKLVWETDQTGAVGRMRPEGMDEVLDKLPLKGEFIAKAYRDSSTLGEAVRRYVTELFKDEGIIVVDGDDPLLKKEFSEIIKEDLLHHKANELVEATSARLGKMGYKTQVFPRKINLFYLENGSRERIVREGDKYRVQNGDIELSEAEILKLIDKHPERFSPNVILRPLYQETILPNLAYVGGPAEVIYWLQLKDAFDHHKVVFPIIMPRNFAMIIPHHVLRKLYKVGLTNVQLFQPLRALKKSFISANTDKEIHLEKSIAEVKSIYESIRSKAKDVDKTLEGFVGAEESKVLKSLENIEKRIHKSEERNHEVSIQQMESVKNSLFPNGSLQERHDNVLNFLVNNDNLIQDLLANFNPFDHRFHLLKESEKVAVVKE